METPTPMSMFGVELLLAVRTDAVAEIGFSVIANVDLKKVPLAACVADLLAGCADGQQTAQSSDFAQGFLEFANEAVLFVFGGFSFADVANDQTGARLAFWVFENH
jgi:hypothetical protein